MVDKESLEGLQMVSKHFKCLIFTLLIMFLVML